MEEYQESAVKLPQNNDEETSIFDDLKPMPIYYSERAVYVFSILFSVIFGAVLMAINIKNTEEKKGAWQIVLFGILYTVAAGSIIVAIPHTNYGLTIVFNGIGGYILKKFFWKKYIGEGVNYKPKSVLIPAIIAIGICSLMIAAQLMAPAGN